MRRGHEESSTPLLSSSAAQPQLVVLNLSLGHVGATLSNDEELLAVVIDHVHPNDLAARAGLRPGDVLCALNDEPVKHHKDAVDRISAATDSGGILAIQYLPAHAAEAARDYERRRAAERAPPRSRWLTVPNVLLVVFALLWLNTLRASDTDAAGNLSPEQLARLQSLALHDAKEQLMTELSRVSTRALHFLSHARAGEALELQQPALLVQMLRLTMALDHMLNVTDFLGLDGPTVNATLLQSRMEALRAEAREQQRAAGGNRRLSPSASPR